ncbi:MAG: hypothetical protein FWF06_07645, partial [Symbiobacteriaceae bacterium]|nr:hypothetical protein [Symbiobacteriaceae bacterium]
MGATHPQTPGRYGRQSPPALTGASLLRHSSCGGVEAHIYNAIGELRFMGFYSDRWGLPTPKPPVATAGKARLRLQELRSCATVPVA